MVLAIDYGGRDEITRAVTTLATEVATGSLTQESIDEESISQRLYTAGLPEVDLMIRNGRGCAGQ